MKNLFNPCVFIAGLCIITILYACKKDGAVSAVKTVSTASTAHALIGGSGIKTTILAADRDGFNAARIDTNLVNPWGIAAGLILLNDRGEYISSNHKGLALIYDNLGNALRPPVTIPAATAGHTGTPTGVVFHSTFCFVVPSNGAHTYFIMCTEDGLIVASAGGNRFYIAADRSACGAVYKGLTIGFDHGSQLLFAANFKGGTIDVFDCNFNYIKRKFKDPCVPSDYGPFNIRYIDDKLYVTYAKRLPPDNKEDEKGAGNGYVDIFNTDGTLYKHLISKGMLNSPWGITKAGDEFALSNDLLVGNYGDGKINVYDENGHFKYQLANDDGTLIAIPGLRALDYLRRVADEPTSPPLYFTAGPNNGSHGLFGYLQQGH